ncbi:hydroxylysine kinase [Nematostella vectensis]|uniref:hydroxylysine kinase n=1 Tax=Nematostella vectensis TaxID=45351 RepID=UPI0020770AFE|nr:hydroxylysine kinase [Nematostella vectensis]
MVERVFRRPEVSCSEAGHLARSLFCITPITEVKELISTSDRNFFIEGFSTAFQASGKFVLKILNSSDSSNEELIYAENAAIDYLRERGYPCPMVLKAWNDKRLAKADLPVRGSIKENGKDGTERCIIRLLELVPGETLASISTTSKMLYQVGEFIGSVSGSLQGFSHLAIDARYDRYDLKNFQDLEPYVCLLPSPKDRVVVREIFASFASEVVPLMEQFRYGTLHNDMRPSNILGIYNEQEDSLSITGLVDFGDIASSMVINEIVVAMAAFMEGNCNIEVSGYLLAGYQALFPVPAVEYRMLYLLVAARMCMLFVISSQNMHINKNNKYLKEVTRDNRALMLRFWAYSRDDVERVWMKCRNKFIKVLRDPLYDI